MQRYKLDLTYKSVVSGAWATQSRIDMREPTRLTPYGGIVYDLNETVGTSTYGNVYGDPRNFMITVRATY